MSERTCVCGPHDDLYDPAQHTEDGHGGCVICHFYEPHTDEEFERVRWPCAVIREAERSAGADALDVERDTLVEAVALALSDTSWQEEGIDIPPDMCPSCVTPWKCNGPHAGATPLDVERAVKTLTDHQRRDAGSCICGWSKWGASHAEHQWRMLLLAERSTGAAPLDAERLAHAVIRNVNFMCRYCSYIMPTHSADCVYLIAARLAERTDR